MGKPLDDFRDGQLQRRPFRKRMPPHGNRQAPAISSALAMCPKPMLPKLRSKASASVMLQGTVFTDLIHFWVSATGASMINHREISSDGKQPPHCRK